MSIEKTVFRNDELALQAPEILLYLQTYATDFFDSITYDEDNSKIVCTKDEATALELYFTDNIALKAYLKNGVNISAYRAATGSSDLFISATRTNNSIIIEYYNKQLTTVGHINSFIITKSNLEDLCFISHGQENAGTGSHSKLKMGLFNKYTWNDYFLNKTPADLYSSGGYMGKQAALTVLAPISDTTYEDYTKYVFLMPANQYFGQSGIFTIDGTAYYTTGYIAVSDE